MKSLLFVPSKPKMLSKIYDSNSDAYIIDLEDSINEADKMQALNDACEFLSFQPNKNIYIRISRNHIYEELYKLNDFSFRGYMIPKFENPNDFDEFLDLFRDREILALVETPKGIVNINDICSCSYVDGIAFGAEDFTSSIGMKNSSDYLNYARSVIVTYSRAYNKKVYDTPSFIIDDINALKEEIRIAVDMGFDGKMAIHPKQIDYINDLFQYFDFDAMKSIVEQYELEGKAVLKIGDNVFEKMHIAHFKRILKEHGVI